MFVGKNAINGENELEDLVVYRQLYDSSDFPLGTVWVRSLSEFSENVEVNGEKAPRFKYLEEK